MRAIAGSGSKRTRSRAALPPTASSASSISLTRVVSAGRFTAMRPPRDSDSPTAIKPSIVLWEMPTQLASQVGTGQTAGRRCRGSRMMVERNPDAAPLGWPGLTVTVISRALRPSMNPFRV